MKRKPNLTSVARPVRACVMSALALTALVAAPSLHAHAAFNSSNNMWTFYTDYDGSVKIWTATLGTNINYNVGSSSVKVTQSHPGYDVPANYARTYPFTIAPASGRREDFRNSGGSIVAQNYNDYSFFGASCNAGDECQSWQTNNTYTINSSSGAMVYYQGFTTDGYPTSDGGVASDTVNV